jgi:hypothetical protein
MFNLGTKTVVLNSNANVLKPKWEYLHRRIPNFAIPTVAAAAGRQGISVAKNAVAGVYTITPVTP